MYFARRAARNLRNASPGRQWGRRRGGHRNGKPERILARNLVASTTRHSRFLDSEDRAARALAPLWALVVVSGMIAVYFLTR